MNKTLALLGCTLAALTQLACAGENDQRPVKSRSAGDRPRILQGTLQDGGAAPDFVLQDIEGTNTVKLTGLKGKPVVLIFGSCTCPPFVAATQATQTLFSQYKDRVHFLLIYIREAHPTDGRVIPGNQFVVQSPTTLAERRDIARDFAKRLKVSIPILVDGPDDKVSATYACWPNRMYILDAQGNIADKGMAAPGGTAASARRATQVLDHLLQGKH
ncbi:MAG: redoxin domain-containing protein [Verrucomicrobia bacterium]|nr:redoxin domain-containing protein [Verrucomicrobiota bacterium]